MTTILAAGAALFLHEIPLRTHTGEASASTPATLPTDARTPRLTGSPSAD